VLFFLGFTLIDFLTAFYYRQMKYVVLFRAVTRAVQTAGGRLGTG
jgi:hypothetical protein